MVNREGRTRLTALGDTALGGIFASPAELAERLRQIDRAIGPELRNSEVNFLNLDCTFDRSGTPPNSDEYLVSGEPESLDLLSMLGIHLVSQANNHSLDYGAESLLVTQEHLHSRGVLFVGAGPRLGIARDPIVIERDGLLVGFLAYSSCHPWVGSTPAADDVAGVAPADPLLMEEDVRRLRKRADCVVVSLHWGKENVHYPPPENVDLGHRIIDWGGHIVLGHHPHVVQGIESYDGGIICYSLGNFLYPDYPEQGLRFTAKQRESLLVRFSIGRGTVDVERVVPLVMSQQGIVTPLPSPDRERLLSELGEYSDAVSRDDYEKFWRSEVRKHELRRLVSVIDEEVIRAGWIGGARRLLKLGRKNVKSIGRSVAEIVGFGGKT